MARANTVPCDYSRFPTGEEIRAKWVDITALDFSMVEPEELRSVLTADTISTSASAQAYMVDNRALERTDSVQGPMRKATMMLGYITPAHMVKFDRQGSRTQRSSLGNQQDTLGALYRAVKPVHGKTALIPNAEYRHTIPFGVVPFGFASAIPVPNLYITLRGSHTAQVNSQTYAH